MYRLTLSPALRKVVKKKEDVQHMLRALQDNAITSIKDLVVLMDEIQRITGLGKIQLRLLLDICRINVMQTKEK